MSDQEKTQRTRVCGIGASAGGLEALVSFFSSCPVETGLAFVVVQHLSPDHRSLMAELLSRETAMQVERVEDGVAVQPNVVYIMPRRHDIELRGGRLILSDQEPKVLHLPIDRFFRSLAEDAGSSSIAIVLSGTGSDGTRGIRAIKEAGGLTVVQNPETARFDGMPRSALATGAVDEVLDADQIPGRLVSFLTSPILAEPRLSAPGLMDEGEQLAEILGLLKASDGIDFSHYKPATVIRRTTRRAGLLQLESVGEYLQYLRVNPRELDVLRQELLISVTRFFRDTEVFDALRRKVIPRILESAGGGTIRVWSAGCATGEEAYSLAMTFDEVMRELGKPADVKIFATDVDQRALEYGSAGLYPESIVADVGAERLERYFVHKGEGFQVARQVRRMVIFAPHNVLRDPPFSRLDLLTCRNLLIYLKPYAQRRVLSVMHFALRSAGFLCLGSSETVGELADAYDLIDGRARIFRRRADAVIHPGLMRNEVPVPLELPPVSRDRTATSADPILRRLVKDFAPSTLLIDARGVVQQVIGEAGRFLTLPEGRVTLDVLQLARRGLAAVLGVAIGKVRREQKEVVYRSVQLGETESELVDMRVRPVLDLPGYEGYLMVHLEPVASTEPLDHDDAEWHDDKAQRLRDLQEELRYTRENLQAAIEELETSNEELQATNEELVAANEELQSTNEELQATNEEMQTLNEEYQRKILELTELNEDMDNLLHSTELGTVFLDRDLLVRKFTPAVTGIVNLLQRDVGRPIEHISHTLVDTDFAADARRVLGTGKPRELACVTHDGHHVLVRLLPYRDSDGQTKGVVANFVDVTDLHSAEARHQSVIDALPEHIALLDGAGRILATNAAWRHAADQRPGLAAAGEVGADYLVGLRATAAAGDRAAADALQGLEAVLAGRRSSFSFQYPVVDDEGRRWFLMRAVPLRSGPGLVLAHVDLSPFQGARSSP